MNIFPESISQIGSEMDRLFWIITAVVTLASIVTLFLFIYPIVTRKRIKTKKEMYMIGDSHKTRKWIYIGMIVLFLGDIFILVTEHPIWVSVEQTLPEPDFKIAIIGKQWMWNIIYPGPDGELYTDDDVMAYNELHIPVDKVVHMDIKALDVVHSVFLPQARFKQDALPGRTITRWIKLNKTGKFDITCAEICGTGHTIMRGTMHVEDEQTWNNSIKEIYKKQ